MRWLLVVVGATLLVVMGPLGEAEGSPCPDTPHPDLQVAQSTGIVVGAITEWNGNVATFRVDRVVKGSGSPEVLYLRADSLCGKSLHDDGPRENLVLMVDELTGEEIVVGRYSFMHPRGLEAIDQRRMGEVSVVVAGHQHLFLLDAEHQLLALLRLPEDAALSAMCPTNQRIAMTTMGRGTALNPPGVIVVDLTTLEVAARHELPELPHDIHPNGISCRSEDGADLTVIAGGNRSIHAIAVDAGNARPAVDLDGLHAAIQDDEIVVAGGSCGQLIRFHDIETLDEIRSTTTGPNGPCARGPWIISPDGDAATSAGGWYGNELVITELGGETKRASVFQLPTENPDSVLRDTVLHPFWFDNDHVVAVISPLQRLVSLDRDATLLHTSQRLGEVVHGSFIEHDGAWYVSSGHGYLLTPEGFGPRRLGTEQRDVYPAWGNNVHLIDPPARLDAPPATEVGAVTDLNRFTVALVPSEDPWEDLSAYLAPEVTAASQAEDPEGLVRAWAIALALAVLMIIGVVSTAAWLTQRSETQRTQGR